jgi:hypothetical protein
LRGEPIWERFSKIGTYEIYRVVCNLVSGLPPRYRDDPGWRIVLRRGPLVFCATPFLLLDPCAEHRPASANPGAELEVGQGTTLNQIVDPAPVCSLSIDEFSNGIRTAEDIARERFRFVGCIVHFFSRFV